MRTGILKVALIASILSQGVIGCSSRPVIVADPPQHVHNAPEVIPWEEEYSRSRPKPEVFGDSSDAHSGENFQGDLEKEGGSDQSGPLTVLADVIAFPFRGIGWVINQIF
jgi:hypothetical protein